MSLYLVPSCTIYLERKKETDGGHPPLPSQCHLNHKRGSLLLLLILPLLSITRKYSPRSYSAIKKYSHSSSPSPFDQITYSIVKRCPVLYTALLNIYNHCWQTSTIPYLWKKPLVPKENSTRGSFQCSQLLTDSICLEQVLVDTSHPNQECNQECIPG